MPNLTSPDSAPTDTLLLFADISGYTRYIKDNPYAAVHALQNIRSLLDAVMDQLEPEFMLAKLEGDAAFMYAPADTLLAGDALPRKLQAGFAAFDQAKQKLISVNICSCSACMTMGKLDLKFILHQGPVLHFMTRRTTELGGLPVILLHRLSKNQVQSHRYVLWTLPLSPRMQVLQPVSRLSEHYDEIGNTPVEVHELQSTANSVTNASAFEKFRDFWRKELPWWWLGLRGVQGRAEALWHEPDQH